MCLSTVSKEKPEPTGVGYKMFCKSHGRLRGQFSNGSRKTRTWLKAKEYTANDLAMRISGYTPGFHIYKTRGQFHYWEIPHIRKVKYRRAYLAGAGGDGKRVIVAEEIYIYPGKV